MPNLRVVMTAQYNRNKQQFALLIYL